jgi:sugar phosphate isomerase/epimerase
VALGELADVAARVGMRIAFEPLNPVLFNTDTALWGLDRALELVKQVNHPSLGICCDTWNIFETCCVEDVIRECGRRIVLVQVSDWRRPRSGADRRALGDGTIDTVALVRALRKAQYDGPYVLEIFSSESLPDSLWKGDLEDTIARSREAFALIWSAAEADVS